MIEFESKLSSIKILESWDNMEYYRNVHFRIDSGYKWGSGWQGCSSESIEGFNKEIQQIFIDAGWTITLARFSSSCPNAIKGKSKLYLHPMEVGGAVEIGLIKEVEQILSNGQFFVYQETYIYGVLHDMSDEEYYAYLEAKKSDIENEIINQFKTKRKNLYITATWKPLENIREKFRVKRIDCNIGRASSDIELLYINELFIALLADGKIIESKTKSGVGYRTA